MPRYRLLWSSSVTWYLARWLDILLAGWLALELTNSPWQVALIGFFRTAPVPFLGAFAGAIADRLDRRWLVVGAASANAAGVALIAGLLFAGRLEYWHLAAASLVHGITWTIEWPVRRALMPDAVSRDLVVRAVVLDNLSQNVAKVLGPLAGGALIASLGAPLSVALLLALRVATILPLLALRLPPAPIARPIVSALRFLGEGLDFCRRHPAVRGVLLVTVIINCLGFPYVQLLPIFARDVLFVGPFGLGMLTAADGLGALLGTIALTGAGRVRRAGLLFVAGSLGMCLCLALFAASPAFALSLGLLILSGIAQSGFSTFQSTIVLGATGDALRGRAMGVLTLAIGSAPVGFLLIGVLAGGLGAPAAVAASAGAGALAVGLTSWRTPGLIGETTAGEMPPSRRGE